MKKSETLKKCEIAMGKHFRDDVQNAPKNTPILVYDSLRQFPFVTIKLDDRNWLSVPYCAVPMPEFWAPM